MARSRSFAALLLASSLISSCFALDQHSRRRHHARAVRQGAEEKRSWEVMTVWVPDGTDTAFPTAPPASTGAASAISIQPIANALVNPGESASSAAEQGVVTVTTEVWWTEYNKAAEPTTAVAPTAVVAVQASASEVPSLASSVVASSAAAMPTAGAVGGPVNATKGKKVFAHFMVGVVSSYQAQDWVGDMQLAKSYGIDGFVGRNCVRRVAPTDPAAFQALNIGKDPYTNDQLNLAYDAAQAVGFLVFISFDVSRSQRQPTVPVA